MSFEFLNFGIGEPLVLAMLLPIALGMLLFLGRPRMNVKRWIFLLTRCLLAFLVLIALSSPYLIDMQDKFQDVSSVTILSDRSASMDVYGASGSVLAADLYADIRGKMKNTTGYSSVDLKEFSAGNQTGIGDVLYQNSAEFSKATNLIVLVSDGNNNFGRSAKDVARMVAQTGAKIYAVAPEKPQDEVYVEGISGEKKNPVNAEYPFTVDVGRLGKTAKYQLTVYVDGRNFASTPITQSEDHKSYNYTVSFADKGVHIIKAQIVPETQDRFDDNNVFLKAVDVVDKPKVLVVTDQKTSPLVQVLSKNYDVMVASAPLPDYNDYSAVYVDNVNGSEISDDAASALQKYVIDGNGLVVVGGDKSYERGGYKDEPGLEALLPVRSVEQPEKKRQPMAVILLIDISQSTGYGLEGDSKINLEKALALNIVEQLDDKDMVAVIAFNVEAFDIEVMRKLEDTREEINDKVPRLQFGGGTDILPALDRADQLLAGVPYPKQVILLSDGVIGVQSAGKGSSTLDKVSAMKDEGITLYTIGVGFDTDEAFMANMAAKGGGIYFKPEAAQRLKMEFSQSEAQRNLDVYKLSIYNKYHFITQNLNLPDTSIGDYNDVTPKSIAQVLVTAEGKQPIVTVWRYGLGRVASLTTDDGTKWSPALYGAEHGQLISALTNWAIGDLEKKNPVRIETADIAIGQEAEALISSQTLPKLSVKAEAGDQQVLEVKQTDVGVYSSRFTPNETGAYRLAASTAAGEDVDAVAVNYPLEYQRLGVDMAALSDITGYTYGRVYNASQTEDLEKDAMDYIKQGSLKKIESKTSLAAYFAAAALLLFFVDVVIRRIKEIKRLREE